MSGGLLIPGKKNNHSNSGPSEGEDLETEERSPKEKVRPSNCRGQGQRDQEGQKRKGGTSANTGWKSTRRKALACLNQGFLPGDTRRSNPSLPFARLINFAEFLNFSEPPYVQNGNSKYQSYRGVIRNKRDKLSQSLLLKSKIINKYSEPVSKFLF